MWSAITIIVYEGRELKSLRDLFHKYSVLWAQRLGRKQFLLIRKVILSRKKDVKA